MNYVSKGWREARTQARTQAQARTQTQAGKINFNQPTRETIMSIEVTTNNNERLFLDWDELTEAQQAEFDYLNELMAHNFIKYAGEIYELGDFTIADNGWDGYYSETYSSGLVIKVVDSDHYIIGRYYKG